MRPRRDWFDLDAGRGPGPTDVAIVGLPFDGAVSLRGGAALGPARIREVSRTAEAVSRRGRPIEDLVVRDLGDLTPAPGQDQAAYFAATAAALAALPPEAFVITLGGDNSVSIPAIEAFARRHPGDVGVVWFDAHPDLFEAYEGSRLSHAAALRTSLAAGRIPPARAMLLGVRSFALEEVRFARERGLEMVTGADLAVATVDGVVARIARRMAGASALFLAVDVDAFDAASAPGTGFPMPGGPSSEFLFAVFERLLGELPIRAMDVTEVAPPLDHNDVTSFLAAQVVLEALAVRAARRAGG